MRAATVALFVVAGLVSSVTLSGSSKPPAQPAAHHALVQAR
jgi:hypothetical protein